MARLSLSLLGAVQLSLDSAAVTAFDSDKVRALLIYLAVEAQQPHRRESLVGLLWPESAEAAARRSLNQALYNLRRSIGDQSASPPYLHIRREALQFNSASEHTLDVATFTTLLDTCERHPHQRIESCLACAQRLQQAAALYRGSFLEQFSVADSEAFEEWTLVKREALHRRALQALTQLAAHYEARGEYQAARRYAARQLELDPWREEAHRQLMRALALAGERSAALNQYESCRRVLADELGVEPSEDTTALYRQIQRGEIKSERVDVSPARIANLPAQVTPFVGREREVQELGQLLADPAARLVTLVGPGGIGKTRLALHVAAQQAEAFAHGVAFVPLASVATAELILPAIAEALGFALYGRADPQPQMLNYLREKQLLMVLDNVEHLLEGAGLLNRILLDAPEVKLVVTSREQLNLHGEWAFEVGGLSVPADDQMQESDAAALFLQRARRAQVGFVASDTERREVARICRMVDGMPLAVELAAAWVRTLSCAEIAQELERNLDFLTASTRDLPERHRSLRAVFDHSWRLLAQEEQQMLRRLAVFSGGFTREAAEQVAGASLVMVSALVAKSLLRRSTMGRYDMHDLVRQYAAARLAADPLEEPQIRDRHCSYYTALLQAQTMKPGYSQKAIQTALAPEMDNVRQAWAWAVQQRRVADMRKGARNLFGMYFTRGWLTEGVAVFRHAAEALDSDTGARTPEHDLALAQALTYQAALHPTQSQQTHALLGRSLALLRSTDDTNTRLDVMISLGILRMASGAHVEARQAIREALDLGTATEDQWSVATCTFLIGAIDHAQGDYAQAEKSFRQSLAAWREMGESTGRIFCLVTYGDTLIVLGRFAEAQALLREGLEISQSLGDRYGAAVSLDGLGRLALAQGYPAEAQSRLRDGMALFEQMGLRYFVVRAHTALGDAASALGEEAGAWRNYREALGEAMEAQLVPTALDVLVRLAGLLARAGAIDRALELSLQVLKHPSAMKETKDQTEQVRAGLVSQLTPQRIEAAQARACAISFEAVVQETLSAG